MPCSGSEIGGVPGCGVNGNVVTPDVTRVELQSGLWLTASITRAWPVWSVAEQDRAHQLQL